MSKRGRNKSDIAAGFPFVPHRLCTVAVTQAGCGITPLCCDACWRWFFP